MCSMFGFLISKIDSYPTPLSYGGDGAFRLSNARGLQYLHQVYSNLINPGSVLIDAVDISPDGLYIIGNGTNSLTGLDEEYLLAVNGITSVNELDKNPQDFSLSQNYPNPFNPSTKISWQSPFSSWQTLKIFNSLGQEVETIVNEYLDAGVHSKLYIVNSTLPSGVYYYQLRAGDYIQTKKMILMK